jgi:hypothetical protein
MLLEIAPGSVAVPSANNSGTVLCVSDALENLTLDPAEPTGMDRQDLIVCQARGADLDGGTDNDFVFAIVKGTPYAPPGSGVNNPVTPPGAVDLARVGIVGGSAAINPATIVDLRPGGLAVPPPAPTLVAAETVVTVDTWGNWTLPLPAGAKLVAATAVHSQEANAIVMVRHANNAPVGGNLVGFRCWWTGTPPTNPTNTALGASYLAAVTY